MRDMKEKLRRLNHAVLSIRESLTEIRSLYAIALLFALCMNSEAVFSAIPATQRAALVNLYNATGGSGWTGVSGWIGPPGTECNWRGVGCDPAESTVTRLLFDRNNLRGDLPSLSGLPDLEWLMVQNSFLTGRITTQLEGLRKLQIIQLSWNQFEGSIPALDEFRDLKVLQMAGNGLTGLIPPLHTFKSLEDILLRDNQLEGNLPPISELSNLVNFDATNNRLTGAIPPVSGMPKLQRMHVADNRLTGSIPALANLPSLMFFNVKNNRLTGRLPGLPAILGVYNANPASMPLCHNGFQEGDPAIDSAWIAVAGEWKTCQDTFAAIDLLNAIPQALASGRYDLDPQHSNLWPSVNAFSADGRSAVVISVEAPGSSPSNVTLRADQNAWISPFDPNFLTNSPPANSESWLDVNVSSCDSSRCTYRALLWPPAALPTTGGIRSTVTVTASHPNWTISPRTITLQPPPVLLVHGIWSNAQDANFAAGTGGLRDWLLRQDRNYLVEAFDYNDFRSKGFADPELQDKFAFDLKQLLLRAGAASVAARKVDVVAHSMGGLVTKWFLTNHPWLHPSNASGTAHLKKIIPDPVGNLVTIGTPYFGSELARQLDLNKTAQVAWPTPLVADIFCALIINCTLADVFAKIHKPVEEGVKSLIPGPGPLSQLGSKRSHAIVGLAPPNNLVAPLLNTLIKAFVPAQRSIDAILGSDVHDTIVTAVSQAGTSSSVVTINDVVHATLAAPGSISALPSVGDVSETASPDFWNEVFRSLTLQEPPFPARTVAITKAASAAVQPFFDLEGYGKVDPSNISFSPPTGSRLTTGVPVQIQASSVGKTLVQVLLFRDSSAPQGPSTLYTTESPFVIPFQPATIGGVDFNALAVFDDQTYAVARLQYSAEASAAPSHLELSEAPLGSLDAGMKRRVYAFARFGDANVDVSSLAEYIARSGSTDIFSIGANGLIVANNPGVDWLDVSYGGLTVSVAIKVVAVPTYALTVVKAGSGSGVVSSDDGLLNCGTNCVKSLNQSAPAVLTATPAADSIFTGWLGLCTGIGTCAISLTDNSTVSATFALSSIGDRLADVDGNSQYDALSDGLIAMRYLFGLRGASLMSGVLGANASRTSESGMLAYLEDIVPKLDVDGNGKADALTDGMLFIRYLFGLRGGALVSGAIGSGATREAPDIETHIRALMP